MASVDELLKPSLESGVAAHATIYSTTASFASAFFGGPFAAIAMAGLNSWRLRRLGTDALPLLAGAALSLFVVLAVLRPDFFGLTDVELSRSNSRVLLRAFALLLFGGFWLLHRRFHRSMQILGLAPPNGWLAGVACILAGVAITTAMTAVFVR